MFPPRSSSTGRNVSFRTTRAAPPLLVEVEVVAQVRSYYRDHRAPVSSQLVRHSSSCPPHLQVSAATTAPLVARATEDERKELLEIFICHPNNINISIITNLYAVFICKLYLILKKINKTKSVENQYLSEASKHSRAIRDT